MAVVKPFKGIRPPANLVESIASRPYDVLNSSEAKAEAEGNPMSLYRIIKPEIDFENEVNEHDERVYQKAAENYQLFKSNGWLQKDHSECYYLYAQTMDNHIQYGLVVCAAIDEYMSGKIKKHELTRKAKEEDRMKHVRVTDANIEPVFLSYPNHPVIDAIVDQTKDTRPEYDFISTDGFGHKFWVINDARIIDQITHSFSEISGMYIADGHHRSAAAALVGNELRSKNTNHSGKEEYNYFMAVCFPDNQLKIMDYNRLIRDLNGLTDNEFLEKIKQDFVIEKKGKISYKPNKLHNFSLYISGNWYSISAKEGRYDDNDPIECLDVTLSTRLILNKILNITDLRSDDRIDFVGGIRGLDELKKRVDSGEMRLAIALFPVTMKQLIHIADSGNIMPPKTTWFEPKLRSGLIIHEFETK